MASPFDFYICPDCGIDVNIVEDDEKLERDDKKKPPDLRTPTDLRTSRKYFISETTLRRDILDYDSIEKLNQRHSTSEGNLSPLSPITLPPYSMEKAGIPTVAKYYAYIHPPPDLSDLFDYDAILHTCMLKRNDTLHYPGQEEEEEEDHSTRLNILRQYRHLATSNFAVFGGFAYFDKNYKLLRVNALSMQKTDDYRLHLSGPYEPADEVSKTMVDMGRSDPILLKLVQEAGFVSKSFVRPGETFKGKYVVSKKLSAHGAFVYHRDNGTSMVYVVARNARITLDGASSIFDEMENYYEIDSLNKSNHITLYMDLPPDKETNCFHSLADSHYTIPLVDKFEFSKVFVLHDDFDECIERVLRFVQQKEKPTPDNIDRFPLLHQALKAQRPLDDIKSIVKTFGFDDKKDKFGWSALHYACRFNADNFELIAWLLSKDALNTADHLGRYPLHLACDSSPSSEVVSFLLHVSKCNGDHLVSRPTSILKRLPLHIACSAGASAAVIEVLLKADGIVAQKGSRTNRVNANFDLIRYECDKIDGDNRRVLKMIAEWKAASSSDKDDSVEAKKSSLSEMTLVGRTALHLAINKRLPPETIKMLLSGDNTIVNKWYRGMLPLHMAIMNHYGEDTIKLLVDKDKEGTTLMDDLQFTNSPSVGLNSVSKVSNRLVGETQDEVKPLRSRTLKANNSEYDFIWNANPQCLYSKPSSDDQLDTVETAVSKFSHRSLTGFTKHLHGIRALHLCFLTRSMSAARLLLQREMLTKMKLEDKESYASVINQQTGRTSLHMACAINCELDIIKLLCEADPKRSTITMRDDDDSIPLHLACGHKDARYEVVKELLKSGQVGQPEMVDRLNRNPLARAVQANAPVKVLAVLLEPMNVDVDRLDDRLIAMLAGRIKKDGTLQTAVILIMAQRIPFALLLLQLTVNLLAAVTFCIHVELMFDHNEHLWTEIVLICCLVLLFARELIQIASQQLNYIFDVQNFFELANMIFLGLSVKSYKWDLYKTSFIDPIPGEKFDVDFDRRTLLMVTAILLIANFIFSLRSAFLPFARFVGGLRIIFLTLLPFFIVAGAILISFSFTYRIAFKISNSSQLQEIKDLDDYEDFKDSLRYQCIHSYDLCLTKTLQAFFSGGDVESWLDVVFGVVAIIILLNVVIAIVSDAWEDARDRATDIYWRGRIAFLSETSVVIQAPQKWRLLSFINSCFKSLFERIDNMKRISLEEPNFDWSKDYPYCLVTNKLEYDNPDHYLQEADAGEIKNIKTFKSDLRWLKDSIIVQRHRSAVSMAKDANEEVQNLPIVKITWLYACLWCKWFWLTGWYAVCLVIGLPCFGIWWPRPFRKYILSFGNLLKDGENEDERNKDNDSKLLREEMKKHAYRIEAVEGTNEFIDDKKKQAEKDIVRTSSSIQSRASLRRKN